MSLTVQQGIPATLIAGDAVSFKVSDTDFPASTWTSKIVFKDESGTVKTFDGTASGSDHLFSLTNTQAATLVAGQNLVCLQFSDGTNRQTSDWTEIKVLPDPATVREPTFAQAQVALLRGGIAKLNAGTHTTVNFNGQSFTRVNLPDYQKQLTYYEARVIREQKADRAARGLINYRSVSPQFVNDENSGVLPASTLFT
jgi:hypothetical protein